MSLRKNFIIGLMLFALFLGAGNIIFPPKLGQLAGSDLAIAMFGFLITGVGLPLLAILAIAHAGGNLRSIADRVHPIFGVVFTMIVYLAIGPFFGIPRTATVSYEIGVSPFLSNQLADAHWPLFVFSILFFAITIGLALNPAKLVDRIGKFLTPILFLVIALLAIKSFTNPIGTIGSPNEVFGAHPFFKSFVEGYLTMDVIAALIFGSVITAAIHGEGVTSSKGLMKSMIIAGIVAAVGLGFVYISLGYIGATSMETIGIQENGGVVLSLASELLYGSFGPMILAITILFACLTTSVGLVSACAQFFSNIVPSMSYKTFVVIFAIFSAIVANVGLTQLISLSLPVLLMIYPLAIVLMLLSFIDNAFGRRPIVYVLALTGTALVSIFDGLAGGGIVIEPAITILKHLPLHEQQIGWLMPAIVGGIIGWIITLVTPSRSAR
ncbi:branched-chain amino acid transport system II carrier protein [Sporosarcina aquimarina]|uniref:Branched-chain amino acid transport system carrier protein n=1 Tax=Sporosarcina aquimarina TaxID=114975 RepID=A0ABU4G013_9BACL|nr:branched-chain amino acid transport system II carrier protein [Sporosarcina aquimarina]MDW0110231.1 branched-chain amino acid transport system II carrier protein [Sporosarcina aquimarina]